MDPEKNGRKLSPSSIQTAPSISSFETTSYSSTFSLVSDVIRRHLRRRFTRPVPDRRCMSKGGESKLAVINVDRAGRRYAKDIFTSLLELKWRWIFLLLILVYMGSWTIFAIAWYVILYMHGDIQHFGEENWVPCVAGIRNFATAFLFSLETQQTIGYGGYPIRNQCPQAISLLCIQAIVGVIIEGLMVGLVFAKVTRAKHRSATLAFSWNAVICQRDGKLCLMFRIGDLRTRTNLLQASIRAQVIRRKTTLEGEVIELYQDELKINGCKEEAGRPLLFWPSIMVHTIDGSSPLYHLEPTDLGPENDTFEIIVALEGIVETTGMAVQAKTSYLPSEIRWGYSFEDVTSEKSPITGERVIDFSRFHNLRRVATTTMSAAKLEALARNSR